MTDQQSAVLAPRGDAPSGRPEAESPARKWTQSLSLGRYTGVVVALLVVAIYLTITEPVFLTWDNLMNIVKSNSVIFVLAIGATFVVISGGIDLSTASATTATAMIFGLALHADWALVPALAAAIGFGLMIGLINGVLITKAHIVLVTNPETPAKTLRELIDLAKSSAGKLSWASAGCVRRSEPGPRRISKVVQFPSHRRAGRRRPRGG